MSVRIGGYDYKTKAGAEYPGYTPILIHPGKANRYSGLSPYALKDSKGRIYENVYQGMKVYPMVSAQRQFAYVEGYRGRQLTWEHPSERHLIDPDAELTMENLTPEFCNWRNKLLNNEFAIRYTAGFRNRHTCRSLLTEAGEFLSYVPGRKVYIDCYTKGDVREHPLYLELQQMLERGQNLLLMEVDGPRYHESAPFNELPAAVKDCSLPVTAEIVSLARNNPNRPFGHGWVLAAMLAGLEECM